MSSAANFASSLFGMQIIGREELTQLSPWNSVRAKKLTEFGV